MLSIIYVLLLLAPQNVAATKDATNIQNTTATKDATNIQSTTATKDATNTQNTTTQNATTSTKKKVQSETQSKKSKSKFSSHVKVVEVKQEEKTEKTTSSDSNKHFKIGSEIFGGYHIVSDDTGQKNNDFFLDRTRLNFYFMPENHFKFRVTTDLLSSSSTEAGMPFFKYVWGEVGNIIPGFSNLKLRMGLDSNTWKSHREKATRLRYVAKLPIDMYKLAPSVNLGVKLQGYLLHSEASSFFISVGMYNGNNTALVDDDKAKSLDLLGIYTINSELPINISIYFREGMYDSVTNATKGVFTNTIGLSLDAKLTKALVGAEFLIHYFNEYDVTDESEHSFVFDVFSIYTVVDAFPSIKGYLRFDHVLNSSHTVEYTGQGQRLQAGISYEFRKGLTLSAGTWMSFWNEKEVQNPIVTGCSSNLSSPYCSVISNAYLINGEKSFYLRFRYSY